MTDTIITRAATFEPATFNAEKRTVDVIFSTGAAVPRYDFEGRYMERLSMAPEAVDLQDLIGGPVLNSHDRFDVSSVLGTVDAASVDGKRGVATVRFGFGDAAEALMLNVEAGIVRSVSIGYTVQQKQVEKDASGARTITATRWRPVELSFVALGADAGAKVRSTPAMELNEQIRGIAAAVGVPAAFAEGLIQRNTPIDEARTAIITEAARAIPHIDHRAPATVTRDAADGLTARLADGLMARTNPRHTADAGREFATFRTWDLARHVLQTRGLSTLGTPAELITRALHTTSDFTAILQEWSNKNLLMLSTAPTPTQQIFRRATMSDFRARHILEMSDGGGLAKVAEKGEITWGKITDKELSSYKLESYAKAWGITFKVLINDDVSALSDLAGKMTMGARQWFNGFLVDTIISNPKLADNVAVFHASHANLAGSGAAPGETTIADGKKAMRLQTDLSGNPIDAAPRFIVFPAALEATVDKLLATLYPQQPSDAVVSSRNLTPIVEPRLDAKGQATAWYLFADPATTPVFEYAELEGYQGPQAETRQAFETLGVDVRVVWHLGAGAVDHRGAWKNPG
ncbi:MAG: HK97 family phage prohead protease [Bryobacterales bacterium]|nr:HK97 family phage prohead protease [Bryobacterales bacterium]